jgi:hypothetical protein
VPLVSKRTWYQACPTVLEEEWTDEEAMRIPPLTASGSFVVSRPSAIMPREGAARERRSEMIRAVLIVVVIVAGLMLWFLIPFLDLP